MLRTASGPTGFSQRFLSAKRVEMAEIGEMQMNAAKLDESAESTGRDHDSVFDEQVAKALQAGLPCTPPSWLGRLLC